MKTITLAAAVLALGLAGGAQAAARVTDMDYLKAHRCKGLAAALPGAVDAQAIDAFIKDAGRQRASQVRDRAESEMRRGELEARSPQRRDRLAAELAGPCMAYVAQPPAVAVR